MKFSSFLCGLFFGLTLLLCNLYMVGAQVNPTDFVRFKFVIQIMGYKKSLLNTVRELSRFESLGSLTQAAYQDAVKRTELEKMLMPTQGETPTKMNVWKQFHLCQEGSMETVLPADPLLSVMSIPFTAHLDSTSQQEREKVAIEVQKILQANCQEVNALLSKEKSSDEIAQVYQNQHATLGNGGMGLAVAHSSSAAATAARAE